MHMPPMGTKRRRSSEQCLLTESSARYKDGFELHGEVFELGDTFGRGRRPADFKNMAKLSELIVAILRAAPEARLRRARISSCVREAILLRPRRSVHPFYPIQYVGEMVSKQVLRVCFMFRRNCWEVAFCWKSTYVHRRSVVRIHTCIDASARPSACDEM